MQNRESQLQMSPHQTSGNPHTRILPVIPLHILLLLVLPLLFSPLPAYAQEGGNESSPDNTPPIILTAMPSGTINTNPTILQLTTSEAALCRYDTAPLSYAQMSHAFVGNGAGTTHTAEETLPDGNHTFYAQCLDGYGNPGEFSVLVFTLDTTPALITSKTAVQSTTNRATLHVSTSELATCRFGSADNDYASLPTAMQAQGGSSHVYELTGLGDGTLTNYVRCKDLAGNVNSASMQINIQVTLPVTAKVSIGDNPPLSSGTYDITVKTSKPILGVPTLTYNFNDDTSPRLVSLTGSSTEFEGFMIIPPSLPDKVGTFSFSATDFNGQVGTQITDGKLFLIDTKKPPAPMDLRLQSLAKGVRVQWHFEGEAAEHYQIFRSTIEGVSYIDTHAQSDDQDYTDLNVRSGETYYYRVAAVDAAGNLGELSIERTIFVDNLADPVQSAATIPNARSAFLLREAQTEIVKGLGEIESSIARLQSLASGETSDVMAILELETSSIAAKDQYAGLIAELEGLTERDLDEVTLEKTVERILANAKKLRTEIATSVKIESATEYPQRHSEAELKAALAEFLKGKPTPPANYTDYMTTVQDTLTISTRVVNARVTYLDNAEPTYYTIVVKDLALNDLLSGATAVETIPKEMAAKASDATFSDTPRILNNDPVVAWELGDQRSLKIEYYVKGSVPPSVSKDVRTFVFTQPPSDSPVLTEITPTGAVTLEQPKRPFNWNNLLLSMGVLVVVSLAIYYFYFMRLEERTAPRTAESVMSPTILDAPLITPGTTTNIGDQILNHLDAGHTFADNLEFISAESEYMSARQLLLTSPAHLREWVSPSARGLYNKLRIIQTLKLATENTLTSQEHSKMVFLLNQIKLKRSTPLANIVKEVFGK